MCTLTRTHKSLWNYISNEILFSMAVLGDITQKGYEKKRAKLLARYSPLIQGKASTFFCFSSKYTVLGNMI